MSAMVHGCYQESLLFPLLIPVPAAMQSCSYCKEGFTEKNNVLVSFLKQIY